MKKFLRTLACFAFVFVLMFSFSACKKKVGNETKHEASKETPVVSVTVNEKIYFAGDALSTVELTLDEESTKGSVSWENSNQTLSAGTHTYSYLFVPTDSKTYSKMTKTVRVFAIEKIYKTATNQFGYKDNNAQFNYIEFERTGNTLSYTSNFAGTLETGTVLYEDAEIVLMNSSNEKNYTITISNFITVYDYETGDEIQTIGNLNKYVYPAYLGTYRSTQAGSNVSLTLSLSEGKFKYELNYGEGIESGTFNPNQTPIEFSGELFGTWTGTYSSADNSITVNFVLLSGQKLIKG